MKSLEYLKRHGITDPAAVLRSSSVFSGEWDESTSSPGQVHATGEKAGAEPASLMSRPPHFSIDRVASPSKTTDTSKMWSSQVTLDKHNSVASDTNLPPSDSDEELSIVTRDSIEDLPSTVPRSPKSPRLQALADDSNDHHQLNTVSSPIEAPRSPRRRLKKKLTINLNSAEFDLEQKKRPLSPYTNSGMLRKFVPPSAPAAVTEFGPSIHDEIDRRTSNDNQRSASQEGPPARTTRAERGGRSLMGFLSRRVATK